VLLLVRVWSPATLGIACLAEGLLMAVCLGIVVLLALVIVVRQKSTQMTKV
jgi:tryptophan-rich sensory protein